MRTPHRLRRFAARLVLVTSLVASLAAVALLGAGPAGAASSAKAKWPDLVGTWTGDYRFPSSSNTGVDSTETLIIEAQDGELVWGYNQFVEADGTITKIPLRGSIDLDKKGFGLAESGGFFVGRITGKHTMTIRFFLVAEKFTSFDADLTRTAK